MLNTTSTNLSSTKRFSNAKKQATPKDNAKKESKQGDNSQVIDVSSSYHDNNTTSKPKETFSKLDEHSIRQRRLISTIDSSQQNTTLSNSSKQKTNIQCDSKVVLNSQENLEKKKTTFRVNLIKKSSRQISISSITNQQRPQLKRDIEAAKVSNLTSTEKSNSLSNADHNDSTSKSIGSFKGNINNKESTSSYEKAKNDQKMVVSLIRDISRTVKRGDLDEMLKEITSTIKEVQSNQSKDIILNNNIKSDSGNVNKKRQDQTKSKETPLIATKASRNSNKGDAIHSSEFKKDAVKYSNTKKLSVTDVVHHDNQKNLNHIETNNSKLLDAPNIISENNEIFVKEAQLSVMELSSDEDLSKNLERKPNSSRLPTRCLRVTSSHAKYISPHRKRSLEERLSRAQEAREKFLEYRANKFRDILKKVEEMRAWKEEDTLNLKASVQTKLQKAAAKRKEQLDKIIRKAHDEDSKVSEIQFINNLEAQNRRHDMNSRKKEFEARLQDLQDERQRRFEEKQAKEVAAEERRRTLEAERKAKLLEIQQRRKLKTQKVEQQQQVKEKKRIERNRHRDQKISAIKEAYNAGVQTLRKRINKKQEQSGQRHEVNLRLIRQKAFELSIKRYNSFISELKANRELVIQESSTNVSNRQQKESDTKRLQLKPFNTKKFCNLCKETIASELALFSHLRSESHHASINEHYGNTMLTTNEAVEIHNLRHIVDTDEPLECDKSSNSQQSSRASSLVNYYHSSYLSQTNGGICMSDKDRESLLAIEKKCRKLRHKLIVAGKPFNREWFAAKIRFRLAQLLIKQRLARNQTTNTDEASLANTIDLSANNSICQQNKPFYLKIGRITRELISITTDQRISGGGLMPAGIIHNVDRLLADLNKQLTSRKAPNLTAQLTYLIQMNERLQKDELDADQLAMVTKLVEFYAIDTLFLYDIISCLISILRRIVPNVSLTSKLPSTVASHYSTLIDPVSLNSYYCHRSPILPARIYIKMIGFIRSLCENHGDLCYIIFQSNNMINLSDILSYRLGFIIGNESPASSISGSSSAATLSAQTVDKKVKQQQIFSSSNSHVSSSRLSASSIATRVGKLAESGELSRKNSKRKQLGTLQLNHNHAQGEAEDNDDDDGEVDDEDEDDDYVVDDDNYDVVDDDDDDEEDDDDNDLWDRAETYKRTEEIVDDMTAGLCKLLATVTETILSHPLVLLNQLDKTAFDQRSDDFISYMVSVGIVDTESVIMSHIHQQQHHHKQQNQHQQTSLSASNHSINSSSMTGPALINSPSTVEKCQPVDLLASSSSPSIASNGTSFGHQVGGSSSSITSNILPTTSTLTATSNSAGNSSTNNKIINFTTSCIQFVTSLVKLVIAKLPADEEQEKQQQQQQLSRDGDKIDGNETTQQDKTQLLATLKMSQLSGVLTLVYDMLVHSFNSLTTGNNNITFLTHNSNSNSNSNNMIEGPETTRQLGLALESLRLINYVAYIDVRLFQETLAADEMLPLQLRHVCSFLISHLVHSAHFKIIDCEPVKLLAHPAHLTAHGPDVLLRNELMNELILLLGNFAYLNESNQLMLKSGRRPTTIEQLIGLPFDYFSRANLKLILMPTLISCAHLNDQICALVCQELSLSMLTSFIEDQLLSAQVESKQKNSLLAASSASKAAVESSSYSLLADQLTDTKLATQRWQFERRFAKSKWLNARKYFESQQAKASGKKPV